MLNGWLVVDKFCNEFIFEVNHLEALVMHKTQMTNLSGLLVVGIMVTLVDTLSYQKALSKDS